MNDAKYLKVQFKRYCCYAVDPIIRTVYFAYIVHTKIYSKSRSVNLRKKNTTWLLFSFLNIKFTFSKLINWTFYVWSGLDIHLLFKFIYLFKIRQYVTASDYFINHYFCKVSEMIINHQFLWSKIPVFCFEKFDMQISKQKTNKTATVFNNVIK